MAKMYVIYSESTLQVKQLILAKVKPFTDYGIAKPLELKCKIDSLVKHKLFDEDLEPVYYKTKRTLKDNPRFKTEKCRQFYEIGHCDYGERCMFAHGSHELNTQGLARPRNYKTRICTTFQFDGFCTFGERCAFVHSRHDPIKLLETTISNCPRIPMPENLTYKSRPEFYPSDILTRKPNREMLREEELLPSVFINDCSKRLSTFERFTNTKQ